MNDAESEVRNAAADTPPPDVASHAHHWRIGEASGPASAGVCKICGVTRSFQNWLPEFDAPSGEERRLGSAA